MFFQEPVQPPPSLGSTIIEKIIYYLNYPFVNQKEFKVSILSLLLLTFIVFISWLVSRYIRRLLQKRILPNFHLGPGLQYTLLRTVHYLLITLGLVYALKVGVGIDLTTLAVLLGFLAVGVGFGLQYIASDIVSGFILLFERPIRIGDRIKIDEVEGRVDNIRIRTTNIVTNDEVTVVLPNSKLVSDRVINWSYCNKVRIRIPVGVAYGSDVEKVTGALVEAGRAVELVLDDPPPKVYFVEFGESSLNFELLVWINKPHKHPQIRSDINFQIDRLFRQYNIEIPFPQRDLRLRSGAVRVAHNELEISDSNTLADVQSR